MPKGSSSHLDSHPLYFFEKHKGISSDNIISDESPNVNLVLSQMGLPSFQNIKPDIRRIFSTDELECKDYRTINL